MESLVPVFIQLLSGAAGGNAVAAMMKNLSLGAEGNSIVGVLGGGIGGQIIGMLGMATGVDGGIGLGNAVDGMNLSGEGSMDIGSLLGSVAGGGVGGGALLAIVGTVKKSWVSR